MKTYTVLRNQFGVLTNNTASTNLTLGDQLINDSLRYLTTKYFFNEATITVPGGTVSATTIYLTAAPIVGATSGTLASQWTNPTASIPCVFSDGEQRQIELTYNSTAVSWNNAIYGSQFATTAVIASGATTATLSTAWTATTASYVIYFSDGESKTVTLTNGSTAVSWTGGLLSNVGATIRTSVCTTAIALQGQVSYPMPYNVKTLIDVYINVGNIRYLLTESANRTFWDAINFTPYTSDIPQYYYIWNKRLYVFPTPSSNNSTITYNFKHRLTDLSRADITSTSTSTTITATNGSTTIANSGTAFTTNMVGMWLQASTAPGGDENWYQIATVNSSSSLDLINPYQGIGGSALAFTIGEAPILGEDYQDLPLYRACQIYFTSRVPDPSRAALYKELYDTGFAALNAEFGTKSWSVGITRTDEPILNPNLFQRSLNNPT